MESLSSVKSVVPRKGSDRGGWPSGHVHTEVHEKAGWELLTDALLLTMVRKRLLTVDEHRRVMEDLPRDRYDALSYYQRWITGIEALLVEKGMATRAEIDRAFVESKG